MIELTKKVSVHFYIGSWLLLHGLINPSINKNRSKINWKFKMF